MPKKNNILSFPKLIRRSELESYQPISEDNLREYLCIGRVFWHIDTTVMNVNGFTQILPHIEKSCFFTVDSHLNGRYVNFMKPTTTVEEYKALYLKLLNMAIESNSLFIRKEEPLVNYYIR